MPWLDLIAIAVIVGWACAFLYQRWRPRTRARADGACGRCNNPDCG